MPDDPPSFPEHFLLKIEYKPDDADGTVHYVFAKIEEAFQEPFDVGQDVFDALLQSDPFPHATILEAKALPKPEEGDPDFPGGGVNVAFSPIPPGGGSGQTGRWTVAMAQTIGRKQTGPNWA